jgi:hypothetical protein
MKKYLYAATWIGLFLYLSYVSLHGLFFPDEGYILHSASRILSGQILYKDFDFVYTPIAPLLNVVAFLVFGQSVLGERLFTLLISSLTCICLYKVSFKLLKNNFLSLLVVLLFATFGPGHINFIWPSMLSVEIAIISIYFYLRNTTRSYIVSGGLTVITLLTKQNLGAGFLLAILPTFLQQKQRQHLWQFIKGALIIAGVFLCYLHLTNSLHPFINNMYAHTFERIFLDKSLDTPLFQGSSNLGILAKILLYSSPFWLSLAAIIVSWKRNRDLLLLPFATSAFWIFGIRPVTDYVHLMPLLALTTLPIIILLRQNGIVHRISLLLTVLLISIGLYTSLNFSYYRFKPELLAQKVFISNPKILVFTDPGTADEINILSTYINKNIKKDEKIYLNYYEPMAYFFLDRPNPTRFDYPGIPADLERQLVESLNKQQVPIILTHPMNQIKTGITKEYIEKHYLFKEKVYGYEVWRRI